MQRLSTWLIALLAIAVFAAAGYVIVKKDPVPDAGQVLPLQSPSTVSGGPSGPSNAGSGSTSSSPGGVIAFLGDDWTAGSGASAKSKRFSTLLAEQLGLTERNFGADGTGYAKATASAGTYDSRTDAVVKAGPRVVVVSGGRNDVADYLPTTQRHIRDLFTTLHAKLPNAVIIAVEPFWGDSDKPAELGPIATAVQQSVQAAGGHYLAVDDPIHNHPGFMADASDPNDKGNAAIAKALADPIRALVGG